MEYQKAHTAGLTTFHCAAGNQLFSVPASDSSPTHHNLFGLAVIGPTETNKPQAAAESAGVTHQEPAMSQPGDADKGAHVPVNESAAPANLLQVCGNLKQMCTTLILMQHLRDRAQGARGDACVGPATLTSLRQLAIGRTAMKELSGGQTCGCGAQCGKGLQKATLAECSTIALLS